tara:strand:- start:1315 stop:2163 length:849 start_codon:yes stop_codon:yes gene_type:complete
MGVVVGRKMKQNDHMQGYAPINNDHAIESISFTLSLDRPVGAAEANAIRALHAEFAHELPALRNPSAFRMNIDPGQEMRPSALPGVEFAFLQPDGSPIWALRVVGDEITVECNLYSRWARVWGASQSYLFGTIQALAGQNSSIRIMAANLSVRDAFSGDAELQDPSSCLRMSRFVPEMAFKNGNRWHCHTGWFEESNSFEILHNLNLDASAVQLINGPKSSRLSISHSLTHRIPEEVAGGGADTACNYLQKVFETLHMQNKAVVKELLVDETSAAIGLMENT